jgi:hypothetical protein
MERTDCARASVLPCPNYRKLVCHEHFHEGAEHGIDTFQCTPSPPL